MVLLKGWSLIKNKIVFFTMGGLSSENGVTRRVVLSKMFLKEDGRTKNSLPSEIVFRAG